MKKTLKLKLPDNINPTSIKHNPFYWYLGILMLISVKGFSQYPYLYPHYREVPENSVLWQKALSHYKNNNTDSVLYYINSASNKFKSQEQWNYYLFVNSFKTQVLGDNRQINKAISTLENARKIAKKNIDTLNIEFIENLRFSAKAYYFLKDNERSMALYNRTIKLMEQSGKHPAVLAHTYFFAAKQNDLNIAIIFRMHFIAHSTR